MKQQQQQPQQLVGGLNSYDDYSEGGYQVKRLERVMNKIQSAEKEFSDVDAEREAIMKQVEELTRRADGLEMQAKDIKDDLTVCARATCVCGALCPSLCTCHQG